MNAQRWSAIAVGAITVLVLAGCGAQQKSADAQKSKLSAEQQAKEIRQKQVAELQVRLNKAKAQSEQDHKNIPVLLGASDVALKQSQMLKDKAAQTKDKKARKDIEDRSAQAQKIADQKAAQVVRTRQDYYEQLELASNLEKQISALRGEDQPARRIAAKEQKTKHHRKM